MYDPFDIKYQNFIGLTRTLIPQSECKVRESEKCKGGFQQMEIDEGRGQVV